jgi:hypothetical protein
MQTDPAGSPAPVTSDPAPAVTPPVTPPVTPADPAATVPASTDPAAAPVVLDPTVNPPVGDEKLPDPPVTSTGAGPLPSPDTPVPGPVAGVVDNVTSRHDGDALQGHFVNIDLNHDDVDDDLREKLDGATYGVYLQPTSLDEQGYPLLALVRLRDDSNAMVTVPYAALTPGVAGGR